MKLKCAFRSCCFGFNLLDGVHGIVVWDSLYALFVITTAVNTFFYFAQDGRASQSFTDLSIVALLITRAAIGLRTCLSGFQTLKVRQYFIIRLVWDFAMLVLNCVMVGLKKIYPQNFFFNIFIILLVDGYLNMIIYSYLKRKNLQYSDENRDSNLEEKRNTDALQIEVVFDAVVLNQNDIALEIQDPALNSQQQNNPAIAKQVQMPLSLNSINAQQPKGAQANFNEIQNINPPLAYPSDVFEVASPSNLYRTNSNFSVKEFIENNQNVLREQPHNAQIEVVSSTNKNVNEDYVLNYNQVKQQLKKPIRKGRKQTTTDQLGNNQLRQGLQLMIAGGSDEDIMNSPAPLQDRRQSIAVEKQDYASFGAVSRLHISKPNSN